MLSLTQCLWWNAIGDYLVPDMLSGRGTLRTTAVKWVPWTLQWYVTAGATTSPVFSITIYSCPWSPPAGTNSRGGQTTPWKKRHLFMHTLFFIYTLSFGQSLNNPKKGPRQALWMRKWPWRVQIFSWVPWRSWDMTPRAPCTTRWCLRELCVFPVSWKRSWTGGCLHPDFALTSHRGGHYPPVSHDRGGGFVQLFLNGPDPPSLSSSAQVARCGDCDRGEASGTKVTLSLFSIHPLLPAALGLKHLPYLCMMSTRDALRKLTATRALRSCVCRGRGGV